MNAVTLDKLTFNKSNIKVAIIINSLFCHGPSVTTSHKNVPIFLVAPEDVFRVSQEVVFFSFCSCVHQSIQTKTKCPRLCAITYVSVWIQTHVHLRGCRPPPQWKPHGDQESWLAPELEVPPVRKCLQTQQDIMPKTPEGIQKLHFNAYKLYM